MTAHILQDVFVDRFRILMETAKSTDDAVLRCKYIDVAVNEFDILMDKWKNDLKLRDKALRLAHVGNERATKMEEHTEKNANDIASLMEKIRVMEQACSAKDKEQSEECKERMEEFKNDLHGVQNQLDGEKMKVIQIEKQVVELGANLQSAMKDLRDLSKCVQTIHCKTMENEELIVKVAERVSRQCPSGECETQRKQLEEEVENSQGKAKKPPDVMVANGGSDEEQANNSAEHCNAYSDRDVIVEVLTTVSGSQSGHAEDGDDDEVGRAEIDSGTTPEEGITQDLEIGGSPRNFPTLEDIQAQLAKVEEEMKRLWYSEISEAKRKLHSFEILAWRDAGVQQSRQDQEYQDSPPLLDLMEYGDDGDGEDSGKMSIAPRSPEQSHEILSVIIPRVEKTSIEVGMTPHGIDLPNSNPTDNIWLCTCEKQFKSHSQLSHHLTSESKKSTCPQNFSRQNFSWKNIFTKKIAKPKRRRRGKQNLDMKYQNDNKKRRRSRKHDNVTTPEKFLKLPLMSPEEVKIIQEQNEGCNEIV